MTSVASMRSSKTTSPYNTKSSAKKDIKNECFNYFQTTQFSKTFNKHRVREIEIERERETEGKKSFE